MRALGYLVSLLAFIVTVSWYVVAIGLVLTICLIAASPFVGLPTMRLTIPVSFSVDPGIVRMTAVPTVADQSDQNIRIGSGGFALDIGRDRGPRREPPVHVRGSLRFPTQSRRLLAGGAGLMASLLCLVLWVLARLRAVFRSLRAGKPFEPANATRISQVAYGVIAGEIGRAGVVFLANFYAATHFTADGLRFDARPDFNVLAILCGLIILVIAEVFRTGTRLDEEQSLTV